MPYPQTDIQRCVLKLTNQRLALGNLGENIAFKKLKSLKYKCIHRNYRCPLGEIDLIAKDGDCLVFIEIKTRKSGSVGYAKEAVNKKKMKQISKVALTYMKNNNCLDVKSRFDVVAVSLLKGKENIEVIKNAFDIEY